MGLYERFTDRARKSLALANQEATRQRKQLLDTGDLLYGLLEEGQSIASRYLSHKGLSLEELRKTLNGKVDRGQYYRGVQRHPHSAFWHQVMETACTESRSLNDNYVGTEHLLLGLLREPESLGGQILQEMSVTREEVLEFRGQVVSKIELPLPEDRLNKICKVLSQYQDGKMPAINALAEIHSWSDLLSVDLT
jgi:ATP-dependent Clp protease ATP-binding subunit ClpC